MSGLTRRMTTAFVAVALVAAGLAAAPVPKDDGPKPRTADAKQRARSQNNLKQILLAIHNYHDVYNHLPRNVTDKNGKPLLSWRVALLPYMEEVELFKQFKLDEPWDSDANKKLLPKMPEVFRVGFEEKGEWKTFYQGFAGPGTVFDPRNKVALVAITDGTSNTLAVVEAGPPVEWTKPADIPFDPKNPLPKLEGPFANVLAAATADGAAHKLRRDFEEKKFRDLVTGQDGMLVDFADFRVKLPLTEEDLKTTQKLIEENEKLIDANARQLKEAQKLLLDLVKRQDVKGFDLDGLAEFNQKLKRESAHLKEEVEEMKRLLEKKAELAKPEVKK